MRWTSNLEIKQQTNWDKQQIQMNNKSKQHQIKPRKKPHIVTSNQTHTQFRTPNQSNQE